MNIMGRPSGLSSADLGTVRDRDASMISVAAIQQECASTVRVQLLLRIVVPGIVGRIPRYSHQRIPRPLHHRATFMNIMGRPSGLSSADPGAVRGRSASMLSTATIQEERGSAMIQAQLLQWIVIPRSVNRIRRHTHHSPTIRNRKALNGQRPGLCSDLLVAHLGSVRERILSMIGVATVQSKRGLVLAQVGQWIVAENVVKGVRSFCRHITLEDVTGGGPFWRSSEDLVPVHESAVLVPSKLQRP